MPRVWTKTPMWLRSNERKCIGHTDDFYKASSPEVMRAKNICNGVDNGRTCPFRDTCLRYAIDQGENYGVWGGTSERDRRKIVRARNKLRDRTIYSLEDVRFPGVTRVKRKNAA
jgi:WhiB family transcriptional regulator, redox-sensing transcriptional regulator